MTDRLRSGLVECPLRIEAGFELSKPFAEFGHAEIPVHAGCLDRRVSHENHRAGTLADETQTSGIQSGVKLLPACGALDDGMAALLRDTLRGFFARGVLKVFRFRLGLHPFPPLEILDHISLFIDAIACVHLRCPALPVFDFRHYLVCLVDVESPVRLNDFLRVGMRPVYGDMKVIIARIFMQGVNCLVFGKAHSPEKKTDRLVHLFTGRLFVFLP